MKKFDFHFIPFVKEDLGYNKEKYYQIVFLPLTVAVATGTFAFLHITLFNMEFTFRKVLPHGE